MSVYPHVPAVCTAAHEAVRPNVRLWPGAGDARDIRGEPFSSSSCIEAPAVVNRIFDHLEQCSESDTVIKTREIPKAKS